MIREMVQNYPSLATARIGKDPDPLGVKMNLITSRAKLASINAKISVYQSHLNEISELFQKQYTVGAQIEELTRQKELEEATTLELPMLEKNLVIIATMASVSTLIALLGTVLGMIRSFSALGEDSGGGAAAAKLSVGISEALYNTALGIGTSAFAIMFYNIFTTKIDGITYGIDESGFTLTQSFASLYK
jgi:biopolymer transport protein ExbB/TolQ